ncbi:MAG TPA: DNA mismatch repair endonuclease MutL [bacterium]|nr:DNA mismatch repair endonuclease MutL [bacterium]
MGVIKALDQLTISKIAAGEVVERPVSVVKELIENAIDAKSTDIKIEIEDGGRRLIRISDNGIGMGEEDAAACLKSHTTSKLGTVEDLESIITLGFRGEALHSVGAVAQLTVTTSDNDSGSGWNVSMNGGEETGPRIVSRVRGTTIQVENLFYNIPARRKFLKSSRSEITAINSLVSNFIIAFPEIKFHLSHNEKTVFNAVATGDYLSRIRYIMGRDVSERLVHATAQRGRIGLNAFFSMPDTTFPNRKYQIFFVNGRLVRDRHLTVAVDTSYRGLVPAKRFGFAVLFLDMPASELDANVHPAKAEVRFAEANEIHSLVYRTLRSRFTETGDGDAREAFSLAPQAFPRSGKGFAHREPTGGMLSPKVQIELRIPEKRDEDLLGIDPFESRPAASRPVFDTVGISEDNSETEKSVAGRVDAAPVSNSISGSKFRVMGQFFRTYILIELDGRPVFIDQHVASERIIYNELKRKASNSPEQMQLISEPVEVPREIFETLSRNLEKVKSAGLEIEPFGDRAFVIRAVSHGARAADPLEMLIAIANEITTTPYRAADNVLTDKLLTVASCKMAIKAGQELSVEEMNELIGKYLNEEFNRTCPHGRPIIHEIKLETLNAWFKR